MKCIVSILLALSAAGVKAQAGGGAATPAEQLKALRAAS
jgi:hypothetical protein